MIVQDNIENNFEIATFAGGCFWCICQPFEITKGVLKVVAGYAGGTAQNPTYEDYAQKGYVEVVQITYDPKIVSYDTLLDIFWKQIDPTDSSGQFFDKGPNYRTAIFYHNNKQKEQAELSKNKLRNSGRFEKEIVTEIIKFTTFYEAEDYHQQYYKKNPERYHFYRAGSGRDEFLKKVWDKDKNTLTPLQHDVIKCSGTEPAFNNEYWDNKKPGIYVDRISGEALFSSLDKYDSGTGWPSFTRPLESENIVQEEDNKLFIPRIEIRSSQADSHLGHLFTDGPAPTGLRYCMNSAALRFIPLDDLEKEGYNKYLHLFKK